MSKKTKMLFISENEQSQKIVIPTVWITLGGLRVV